MQQLPPPKQYVAKLADTEPLNGKFIKFQFELVEPNLLEFIAGQYVSFLVSDKGERRSYSICSSPEVKHSFEITVDTTPEGLGVNFLKNLQFGQEVQVLGPMGVFIVQEEPREENLVFVATGSGVAPFHSMIPNLLREKEDKREITLYWGLRHEEDMIWQDEFQDLAQAFPNFHFHPVLSQALQEWPLCRGHVIDCLNIHTLPTGNTGYYLCGNAKMIQEIKELLINKGIAETAIHHEKFY
ncbi:MAG: hypothetical protein CO040_02865 [Candidatus Pacebacteria bacterium CG_4_9_14_0_2_um_filter_36_8]|nr:MAG: hypothetical protein CO040_02865 [Candidatus Pacebacteria bacterium CG_4_9_14_0_2_um_filter_36_8]